MLNHWKWANCYQIGSYLTRNFITIKVKVLNIKIQSIITYSQIDQQSTKKLSRNVYVLLLNLVNTLSMLLHSVNWLLLLIAPRQISCTQFHFSSYLTWSGCASVIVVFILLTVVSKSNVLLTILSMLLVDYRVNSHLCQLILVKLKTYWIVIKNHNYVEILWKLKIFIKTKVCNLFQNGSYHRLT